MVRVTASQPPRWAVGFVVGVLTVSWVVMRTVSVPAARAGEHESVPGSSAAAVAPAPSNGIPAGLPGPSAQVGGPGGQPTASPIQVTGVEVAEAGPKSATIVIKTDRAVESYESFALKDPPRLVVDIPNAVHAGPKTVSARGPIKEIRSSQYKSQPVKVVRVVFDLASALPYQVQATAVPLRVVIGEAAPTPVVAEAPKSAPPQEATPETVAQAPPASPEATVPVSAAEGRVQSVDYRPQDGKAEILVRTTGPVTFNVSEVGTSLILEVSGAVIDPQAAKVLDVRQLAGPVLRIRAAQYRLEPDKAVRIVADLKGQVRHDVVQTPEGIRLALEGVSTVAAAPPAPAAPALSPAPAAPREEPKPERRLTLSPAAPAAEAPARLSMDFKDVDINNLLRIIAEVSGKNIVAGEDVKGKVTVRLVDVPWDVALDNILRINGFGYVQEENIIRVAKADTIRRDEEQRRKDISDRIRAQEEAVVEPLTTEIVRVSYADPKKVVESLNKVKSKRGTISVDDRTASLLIEDTENNIVKMRTILRELDQATPQVMIEGRIVTVVARHSRALGITWGFQYGNPTGSSAFKLSDIFGATGPTLANPPAPTGPIPTAFPTSIPAAVNLPVAGPAGAIGLIFGAVKDQLRLNMQLSALEQQSLARTLSTPRIVALDNQEAEVKQGEEVPFTTVDSSGRTTITFKEAVLSLKVTPHVTADQRVLLKVRATDDSKGERIDFAGGFAFPFNKNEATSSILVDNGATVVIGGVRKRREFASEDRVPFLGEVPVLGWLFKRRTENVEPENLELLIFITPRILDEPRQARGY
ncbi:MAG: type IV pilus secretin PilQ [candidate division NC10 bacterium]|nr:type IV pilus secretin PilQ [candidate division NC10 bacterium]